MIFKYVLIVDLIIQAFIKSPLKFSVLWRWLTAAESGRCPPTAALHNQPSSAGLSELLQCVGRLPASSWGFDQTPSPKHWAPWLMGSPHGGAVRALGWRHGGRGPGGSYSVPSLRAEYGPTAHCSPPRTIQLQAPLCDRWVKEPQSAGRAPARAGSVARLGDFSRPIGLLLITLGWKNDHWAIHSSWAGSKRPGGLS